MNIVRPLDGELVRPRDKAVSENSINSGYTSKELNGKAMALITFSHDNN